jgi:Zn-dependent peptidase ImmA (M78 family)
MDATEQLAKRLPDSKRIALLKRNLVAINDKKRSPRRLLWMVDAIPSQGRAARQWRRVTQTLQSAPAAVCEAALATSSDGLVITGSCHAALLFGAVSPSLGNTDVTKLAQVLIDSYAPNGAHGPLSDIGRPEPLESYRGPAWDHGWVLAEEVLEELKPTGQWIDIQGLLKKLKIPVIDLELEDSSIRGVSIAGRHHQYTICINPTYRDGDANEVRRFTLAHELCHLLFDQGKDKKVAVASGPWAPRDIERRANAFAAMFLMPRDLVRLACRDAGPLNSLNGVSDVAHTLHMSVTATIHHLANLNVIDRSEREDLLACQAKESAQRSTGKIDPVRG